MRTTQLSLAVLILASVAHCKVRDPLFCDEDTPCTDPALPYCDAWGVFEASQFIANTCIAEPARRYCPSDSSRCENDAETICVAEDFEQTRDCSLGCHPQDPRCTEVLASNRVSLAITSDEAPSIALLAPATLYADGSLTTESETIKLPVYSTDQGLPVFVVERWQSKDLSITLPAAAIYSRTTIHIDGDVSLGQTDCAPAYGAGFCDQTGLGEVGGNHAGQGGAGTKDPVPFTSNEDLQPLYYSCGYRSRGALQLTAFESIDINGYVDATGKGGRVGLFDTPACTTDNEYSFAGGAGGSLLVEAPSVTFGQGSGFSANGGSGGCADKPGEDGKPGIDPTPGPDCGVNGSGGAGGAANDVNGGDGTTGSNQQCWSLPNGGGSGTCTGGGGGSAGRIRINVADNQLTIADGVIMSPAPSVGELMTR